MARKSKEQALLAKVIESAVIESAVAYGHLDPRGKTSKEFARETAKFLRQYVRQPTLFGVVDHLEDILSQARNFRQDGAYHFACLMYATWFEHWVNSVIEIHARKKRLPEDDIQLILRETNFRAKFTWLFQLLTGRKLNKNHITRIVEITEKRNAFVHYKWRAADFDAPDTENERLAKLMSTEVEPVVRYLRAFEAKHVLMSHRRLTKSRPNRKK